jgi:2-keto-4-pentenoate hydratase/2-oxohepta-3-ene-1,7-dioic acid hydratase in catechol pathway
VKLVSFERDGPHAGAVIGDMILDLGGALGAPDALTTDDIIHHHLVHEVRNLVDNAVEVDRRHFLPIQGTRILPPVSRPGSIVCLGLNYRDHALEQRREPPAHPMLFAKAPSAVTGPFDDIIIRPGIRNVDAEAELAVVIGREGTMIPEEEALEYVAGYCCFNDVSAREIQREDRQWFRGKSFDTFAPCGPWIVTPDELGDPQGLSIKQRLNDTVMQESSTGAMLFGVGRIIAFISETMTIRPCDMIATGTPSGVGVFRDPQIFLADGDIVTVEIERIGFIRNRVRVLK